MKGWTATSLIWMAAGGSNARRGSNAAQGVPVGDDSFVSDGAVDSGALCRFACLFCGLGKVRSRVILGCESRIDSMVASGAEAEGVWWPRTEAGYVWVLSSADAEGIWRPQTEAGYVEVLSGAEVKGSWWL